MTMRKIGVVGAGTMGNGIAQICAASGFDVVMVDVSADALAKGLDTITASFDRMIKKEKISAGDKDNALSKILCSTNYGDFASADLIIEAATENESLKLKILKQVDEIADPSAIIATNTSSMSITKLAAATGRPDRFIGTHFFNPVPLMVLVEIISGLRTSEQTLAATRNFADRIGKKSIVARNSPGFAVNRILCPMINEAIFALQEGLATPDDIDEGMKLGANHPIGPLALADLIGLDTFLSVMEMFYQSFNDPKYRPAPLLKEMVDAGFLGRKSGRGFYAYD